MHAVRMLGTGTGQPCLWSTIVPLAFQPSAISCIGCYVTRLAATKADFDVYRQVQARTDAKVPPRALGSGLLVAKLTARDLLRCGT